MVKQKLSKTQKKQIDNQNATVKYLLKQIEKEQEKEKKPGVRVFLGFDTSVDADTLEILNEKLGKKDLKAENDNDPADDHQGHLGRFVCYLKIEKIK